MTATKVRTLVKVWDLPVRACHWSFAALLPLLWWTAENGEMGWHKRIGIVLLALLVFRIFWGFFGSSTARFSSFLKGPGAVLHYVRGTHDPHGGPAIGHNPVGGWSTVLLLGAMFSQTVMGLFAGDPFDGSTGPLNRLVSVDIADLLTNGHELFFYALAALIGIHIAAIAFYLTIKKDNLVTPMVTGRAEAKHGAPGITPAPGARAVACFVLAAALAIWIWFGSPPL